MLNAAEKKGAQPYHILAVRALHGCTLGLQDQLHLTGAANDTNTEQPGTVTAYKFLTFIYGAPFKTVLRTR